MNNVKILKSIKQFKFVIFVKSIDNNHLFSFVLLKADFDFETTS